MRLHEHTAERLVKQKSSYRKLSVSPPSLIAGSLWPSWATQKTSGTTKSKLFWMQVSLLSINVTRATSKANFGLFREHPRHHPKGARKTPGLPQTKTHHLAVQQAGFAAGSEPHHSEQDLRRSKVRTIELLGSWLRFGRSAT